MIVGSEFLVQWFTMSKSAMKWRACLTNALRQALRQAQGITAQGTKFRRRRNLAAAAGVEPAFVILLTVKNLHKFK